MPYTRVYQHVPLLYALFNVNVLFNALYTVEQRPYTNGIIYKCFLSIITITILK